VTLPVASGYKTRLATPHQRRCNIFLFTKKDASTVGFTDHDDVVSYGGVDYAPAYNRSEVAVPSDLSNENFQYQGIIDSPQVTEEALRVGEWDNARYIINELFWDNHGLGVRFLRSGTVGEIVLGRFQYSAQLDGLAKAYATTFGQLTNPACRHDLYDAGCTIDPTAYTQTGTVTGVGDDVTVYDTARTEAGPTGGVSITGITKANPGIVSLATAPDPAFFDLEIVTISGVAGMVEVNAQTVVHSPAGTSFALGVDTSAFNTYTSGGVVTPLGGSSTGYFTYGIITWLTGDNAGSSMEIAAYVPGQLTLALPMPNAVQIGDTYSIVAGCDKFLPTCRDKFGGNVVNYDGEYYLTGNDRLVNVGKQQ
jgi:hypothetical protein